MNVKRFSLMTGVLAVWAGACMAGSSGVIQFHGSVVEPSCHAASPGGSTLELKGCLQALRSSHFEVRPVRTVKAVGNAQADVKLVADSNDGRYYDQRYVLVDALGKPIQSGAYVVTLTAP